VVCAESTHTYEVNALDRNDVLVPVTRISPASALRELDGGLLESWECATACTIRWQGKVRDVAVRRWLGVVHMPSAMGYVHATKPLAVLEVSPGRIRLWLRPAIIRAAFGVETLDATAGQHVVVSPARRTARRELGGIEIRCPGRPPFYFWSSEYTKVLAEVAAAGFEVSDQEWEPWRA
jgi:hypothetical protein